HPNAIPEYTISTRGNFAQAESREPCPRVAAIAMEGAVNDQVSVTRRDSLLAATALAAASALGAEVDFAPSSATAQTALSTEPGKLAPLPDKLPPSVEARVGKVDFSRGLPTQKGIDQLFEIQDFQRATQLYQWAIPAIGALGWHRASIAN